MPDREKVTKGLQEIIDDPWMKVHADWYVSVCADALAFLKKKPKTIKCKDCKYLIDHYGFMDDGYCENMRNKYFVKFKPSKDFSCADGKRKEGR